jgi:hypothetical protein
VRAKAHSLLVQWLPVPLLVPPQLPLQPTSSNPKDSSAVGQSQHGSVIGSASDNSNSSSSSSGCSSSSSSASGSSISSASDAPAADAIEYVLQAEVGAASGKTPTFVTVYVGAAAHFRYRGYAWDALAGTEDTSNHLADGSNHRHDEGCLTPGTTVVFRVQARTTRTGLCSPSSQVAAFATAAAGMCDMTCIVEGHFGEDGNLLKALVWKQFIHSVFEGHRKHSTL